MVAWRYNLRKAPFLAHHRGLILESLANYAQKNALSAVFLFNSCEQTMAVAKKKVNDLTATLYTVCELDVIFYEDLCW